MVTSYDIIENLQVIMPEIATALFALWALIYGVFKGRKAFEHISMFSILFFIAMTVSLFMLLPNYILPVNVFSGLYVQDGFSVIVKILLCLGAIVSLIFIRADMKKTGIARFEAPVLVVLSVLGMFFMVSSHDFLTLYVGLEMQSLALYILASFNRNSSRAAEAGMKYFILGALASGMILFGISFVYGFAGHTGFSVINEALANEADLHTGVIVGMAFILVGFAFKLSAVPFHMWTPDVYHGAPASVTAFFAIVPKLAAIALLIRMLYDVFPNLQEDWTQIIYFLSAASMIVGAFAGLVQKSIRRLLAYSAIGNMGYAMMGIVAFGVDGISSVIIYMAIYMIMTAGVFGIILSLRHAEFSLEEIDDLAGLSKQYPLYTYILALLMFSLAGIPPMAGFFAKLVVFNAVIAEGYIILAILGVVTSVVAAFYYLRIIKLMFFDDVAAGQEDISILKSVSLKTVVLTSGVIVAVFSLYPSLLFNLATHISHSLGL